MFKVKNLINYRYLQYILHFNHSKNAYLVKDVWVFWSRTCAILKLRHWLELQHVERVGGQLETRSLSHGRHSQHEEKRPSYGKNADEEDSTEDSAPEATSSERHLELMKKTKAGSNHKFLVKLLKSELKFQCRGETHSNHSGLLHRCSMLKVGSWVTLGSSWGCPRAVPSVFWG